MMMRSLIVAALCLVALASAAKVGVRRRPNRIQMLNRPLSTNGDDYIINGEDAAPHSRPYQISYQQKTFTGWFHTCGGSILDETHVLTASHCCFGFVPSDLTIVAGEHHLYDDTDDGTEQRVELVKLTMHPSYNPFILTNDVCVLELAEPLEMNEFVAPVALPSQGQQWESGTPAVCSGWGSTEYNGPAPDELQWLDMGVLSDAECQDLFDADSSTDYPNVDGRTMICALAPGKTPCHGDSGGPLTCGDGEELCGVVSWGSGTCSITSGTPGVFAEVSEFVDWIAEQQ